MLQTSPRRRKLPLRVCRQLPVGGSALPAPPPLAQCPAGVAAARPESRDGHGLLHGPRSANNRVNYPPSGHAHPTPALSPPPANPSGCCGIALPAAAHMSPAPHLCRTLPPPLSTASPSALPVLYPLPAPVGLGRPWTPASPRGARVGSRGRLRSRRRWTWRRQRRRRG